MSLHVFGLLFLDYNNATSGSVATHARPLTVITACQGNHNYAAADTSFLSLSAECSRCGHKLRGPEQTGRPS